MNSPEPFDSLLVESVSDGMVAMKGALRVLYGKEEPREYAVEAPVAP